MAISTKSSSIKSQLVHLVVLYPAIIRIAYLIRQYFEPAYMNSICLIDLVRISAPEHYDVHPFWKHFQANSTCESVTGKSLDTFFLEMFDNGKLELTALNFSMGSFALSGILFMLYRIFSGASKSFKIGRVLVAVFGYILLGLMHASLFFTHSHYQNDLTHLNGNVMHHSEFKVNGSNGSMVGTLPPGLLYLFLLNYITTCGLMYYLLERFNLDGKLYLALNTIVLPAKQLFNMKVIHPYIHTYHKSWYAWPFSEVFRDYEGHVLCHHVSGYCLGDLPGLSKLYDYAMYWHSFVYKLKYVEFQTVNHYVLNIVVDYFLIALTFVLMLSLVFVFSFVIPKHRTNASIKVKAH